MAANETRQRGNHRGRRRRRHRGKGAGGGRAHGSPVGARPLDHQLRLPQGRPAQPAHLRARSSVRAGRRAQSASHDRWRRPGAPGTAERGRLPEQRRVRRQRHRQLWRDGMALHGAGLQNALDLRRGRGQHDGGLAHLVRRPRVLLREGRIRGRRVGRCRAGSV